MDSVENTPAANPSLTVAVTLANIEAMVADKVSQGIAKALKAEDATRVFTDQIAFVKPTESYYMRNGAGEWDVQSPFSETSARKLLMRQGKHTKVDAVAIVQNLQCLVADGFECAPGEDHFFERDGRNYINTYRPSRLVPKEGPFQRIAQVIANVTDGDEGASKWLINWMAYKVQHPDALLVTSPVLCGAQGTGKTLTGLILRTILGDHNCAVISNQQMTSQFNSGFATRLLVQAEEVMSHSDWQDGSDALKMYTGADTIPCEGKHANSYQIKNRAAWIFTSNRPRPVKVERTDRRYSVFSQFEKPSTELKTVMDSMFDASNQLKPDALEEVAAFAWHLLHWQVDESLAKCPYLNEARETLIQATLTAVDAFVEAIETETFDGLWNRLGDGRSGWDLGDRGITKDAVYQLFKAFCSGQWDRPSAPPNFFAELHAVRPCWKASRPWVSNTNKTRVHVLTSLPRTPKESR